MGKYKLVRFSQVLRKLYSSMRKVLVSQRAIQNLKTETNGPNEKAAGKLS
jgi:hypothetical protein